MKRIKNYLDYGKNNKGPNIILVRKIQNEMEIQGQEVIEKNINKRYKGNPIFT